MFFIEDKSHCGRGKRGNKRKEGSSFFSSGRAGKTIGRDFKIVKAGQLVTLTGKLRG